MRSSPVPIQSASESGSLASESPPAPAAVPTQATPWIVSPRFDLLFLANVWWLLALTPWFVSGEGTPHVEFWQIYFLTTPHRWITLFLVATDPDRRGGRSRIFAVMAVVALVLVCADLLVTGTFTCLLLVDYVWNAWHFAAQHAGVLRMYSRKQGGGRPRLETWCLRIFVFYVIVRLAGWSTGWMEGSASARQVLHYCDLAILILPALLLVLELVQRPWLRPGKLCFLASVCGMYGALLWAVMDDQKRVILGLVAASAAFHAVEYLAVVSHYAQRRRTQGTAGLFRSLSRYWTAVLAAYVVVLGLMANVADGVVPEFWLGINLWAAFLHYAFDGMIWKLRKPETAAALGVEIPRQTSLEPGAAGR